MKIFIFWFMKGLMEWRMDYRMLLEVI